jgi:electron transport complex protein RnfD
VIFFSPYISKPDSVAQIMFKVLLALIPGIALYVWYFGPAILVSITLASLTALGTEALMLKLRNRPIMPFLKDNSALLTGWLLALSIPPLAPWWMIVVGTAFSIAIAKHLYGGLGNNLFNPAMIGYAVLIISFPMQMTQWIAPHGLGQIEPGFLDQLKYIFFNALPDNATLDAVTMATPLDNLKTHLHLDQPIRQILDMPIYGQLAGHGSEMVAWGFLFGGLYLLAARIISWHIPVAYLGALFVIAGIFHLLDPGHYRRGNAGCVLHTHRSGQQSHHQYRTINLRGGGGADHLFDPRVRRISGRRRVRHLADEHLRAVDRALHPAKNFRKKRQ